MIPELPTTLFALSAAVTEAALVIFALVTVTLVVMFLALLLGWAILRW